MNRNFPPIHVWQLLLGPEERHLNAVGTRRKNPWFLTERSILGVTVSLLCFFPTRNGSPPHSPHLPTVWTAQPQRSPCLRWCRKMIKNPSFYFPRELWLLILPQKPVGTLYPAASPTKATSSFIFPTPLRLSPVRSTSPMSLSPRRAVIARMMSLAMHSLPQISAHWQRTCLCCHTTSFTASRWPRAFKTAH